MMCTFVNVGHGLGLLFTKTTSVKIDRVSFYRQAQAGGNGLTENCSVAAGIEAAISGLFAQHFEPRRSPRHGLVAQRESIAGKIGEVETEQPYSNVSCIWCRGLFYGGVEVQTSCNL